MEIVKTWRYGSHKVEKLFGHGQGVCDKCKVRHWTEWLYHYDNKTLCGNCLKREIEEDMICNKTNIDMEKVLYTEKHLHILALAKEERQHIKNICKLNNEALEINKVYDDIFWS